MKIEYKTYNIDRKIKNENVISDGLNGWIVVSITVHESHYEVFMKREI